LLGNVTKIGDTTHSRDRPRFLKQKTIPSQPWQAMHKTSNGSLVEMVGNVITLALVAEKLYIG